MNFFSSDEYLDALATVWFSGRRCDIGLYVAEGRLFRLLEVEGLGPVVTDGPRPDSYNFLDFFEPLASAAERTTTGRLVRWLPRVALGAHEVTSVSPGPTARDGTPAPYVDWSRFPQWSAFEAHVAARRASLDHDSKRKRRRLEERFGPLRYRWDDRRPSVFDTALAWKSAQYARSRLRDGLAVPQNVAMFRELCRRGVVVVSSLSAGERVVAVHLGALWQRRFFSWVPAYDREATVLSPGRLLLEHLLLESHGRGDAEFDFLLGDEPYKYHYATHRRVVGPLGTPPFPVSLRKAVRSSVKRALARYPTLLEKARALKYDWTRARSAGPGGPAS
jgi:CelD/BcsL family acetyltransferase involved in cellulose biosynthesis